MAREWKPAQKEALEGTGKLLVSASAGSGKTTVMIEKIMRYIKSGGDLDKLLVLTFSNASASDMKEKLVEKLYATIRNDDSETNTVLDNGITCGEHCKNQLVKLPFAFINTIDGFCNEIYKRYFDIIGGEPGVTVLEKEDADLLFRESAKAVAEEYVSNEDSEFITILNYLKDGRDLEKYFVNVESVKGFLSSMDNPEKFLSDAEKNLSLDFEDKPTVKSYVKKCLQTFGRIKINAERLANETQNLLNSGIKLTDTVKNCANDIIVETMKIDGVNTCKDLLKFVYQADDVKAPRKKNGAEDLERDFIDRLGVLRSTYSDRLKSVKEALIVSDGVLEENYNELKKREISTVKTTQKLIEIIRKTLDKYALEKRKANKIDFSDMEHFALKILEDKDGACKELSDQIEYIYIDEYQDTNRLQEEIIKKVSRNNIFMVGDVKQSIYHFRHADPQLFLNRKSEYAEENSDGKNIRLNENFRSNGKILDFVNAVFNNVMTNDFGGIDYRAEAQLAPGRDKDIELDTILPAVTVTAFEKSQKKDEELPEEYEIENASLKTKKECEEGDYIANKIISIVGQRYVFDDDKKTMRPARYGDIAILYRSKSKEVYDIVDKLRKANVPCISTGLDSNVTFEEIDFLNTLLSLIDNRRQDIPLFAVLRSQIGGFSENEIATIRAIDMDLAFWTVFESQRASNEKVDGFYKKLDRWNVLSHVMGVAELLDVVIAETGLDSYFMSFGDSDKIARVNTFIARLRGKEIASTLTKYLEYINLGGKIAFDIPPSSSDAVTLTTVHKSKGLQYPIVFYVDVASVFKKRNDKIYCDNETGIYMDTFDDSENTIKATLSKRICKLKQESEERLEEMRIMYVAMTRAQSHLFITYTGLKKSVSLVPEDCNSVAEWINMVKEVGEGDDRALVSLKYEAVKADANEKEGDAQEEKAPEEEICKVSNTDWLENGMAIDLTDDYKYKVATGIGTKYSVSELNEKSAKETYTNRGIKALGSQNSQTGTLYHAILEKISFNARTIVELKEEIADLVLKEELPKEADDVDLSVFEQALNGEVFELIKKGTAIREQPFMLYVKASEVGIENCDDKVLIQGIIDLVVSVGEENVLIDYKFSGSDPEIVKERYKSQLCVYKIACEKLLNLKITRKIIYIVNQNSILDI